MDLVRKLIADRLRELGLNRAEVSLRLGKNATYIQQFLTKGSPRELHERERILLAEILKVNEDELRGPSMPLPKRSYAKHSTAMSDRPIDPRLNIVQPQSGAARIVPGAELVGSMDLPVFSTVTGSNGILAITDRAIDSVARPPALLRVQDGYGLLVSRDSMEPALRAGSTALIHPYMPPRPGDLVVLRGQIREGGEHILVKEYLGETADSWKVRRYKPHKDMTLKKSDWPTLHRIVGIYFT